MFHACMVWPDGSWQGCAPEALPELASGHEVMFWVAMHQKSHFEGAWDNIKWRMTKVSVPGSVRFNVRLVLEITGCFALDVTLSMWPDAWLMHWHWPANLF